MHLSPFLLACGTRASKGLRALLVALRHAYIANDTAFDDYSDTTLCQRPQHSVIKSIFASVEAVRSVDFTKR